MPKAPANRWIRNRRHWDETLDAQNLSTEGKSTHLERLLALYETEDVVRAMRHLEPLRGRLVLDLGGGLGLLAILLARQGARVIIADISIPRLQEGRKLARQAGVQDSVHFICCSAEELPFRNRSLDREMTKSVLIHTQLESTAEELARCLSPRGKAAFVEPLSENPFVNLYRRLAAPRIWRDITDYFTSESIRTLSRPHKRRGHAVHVQRLYLTAFLAGIFNYAVSLPVLYRLVEKALLQVDKGIFALLPFSKRYVWFAIIEIHPAEDERGR